MTANMTKNDRVEAALKGDDVDRVPVSAWWHDYVREWSAADLAHNANVSWPTVQRFESCDGVPSGHTRTLNAVFTALSKAGIKFLGTAEENPGVRLKTK